jgi:V/A-type H+-transporting ATPase subunit E
MKNLDKITDKIMFDALLWCQETFDAAEQKAQDIIKIYEAKANEQNEELARVARDKIHSDNARHDSYLAMQRRNAILAEKSAMVDEVFNRAAKNLKKDNPDAYEKLLERLFVSAINGKDGEVCFSHHDYDIADKLYRQFVQIQSNVYPHATLKRGQPLDILSGFVLHYGNISVDCSTDSRIIIIRKSLERQVVDILFGGNSNA